MAEVLIYLEDLNDVSKVFKRLHELGFKWCDGDSLLDEQFYKETVDRVICADTNNEGSNKRVVTRTSFSFWSDDVYNTYSGINKVINEMNNEFKFEFE
ncbi:MAG: hypothetical protein ACRCX2_14115 [Paraclostridium sp.]